MGGIVLDDVTRRFPDGTVAVRNLTLAVESGEFLVIVGPSGSGKSTVLRVVAGLDQLTSGTVRIGDRVANALAPRDRDVAMVFQSYALYPHMSVFENLAFALRLRKVPAAEVRRRVQEAADLLGIGSVLERSPRQLSGGQRQRVAMGRAIVRKPAAFLMDEPLSNLDATLRVQMRTEIATLQQRLGATTLYVTHDQTEAMTMGDRVAVMREGVLQQVDRPRVLYDRPRNLFVAGFIGSPAMNVVTARLEAADGRRIVARFGGQCLAIPPATLERCPGVAPLIGREVLLGIRPEDMEDARLVPGVDAARCLLVQVTLVETLGAEVVVHGEAGARFTARLHPGTTTRSGQAMRLAVDVDRLYLFDPRTEETLGWPASR